MAITSRLHIRHSSCGRLSTHCASLTNMNVPALGWALLVPSITGEAEMPELNYIDAPYSYQLNYTDADGNNYQLVPGPPYEKGQHACHGCAFKFGNSEACQAAPTCTPKPWNGPRLVPSGY